MKGMTKLTLAALLATTAWGAVADDDVAELRQELADAQAEVAQLKAQLAQTEATLDNLPAGIFVPENVTKLKVDRDDDGSEIELSGDIEKGDVKALVLQAQKALQDDGYTVVKESLDRDDDAKLVYEKVTGDVRETIEIEIDKSWLSDKVNYEVEYEKHQ